MRKFTIVLVLLFVTTLAIAKDSQRKISTGKLSSSAVIVDTPAVIYDVEVVATSANGYAVLFDSSTADMSGKKEMVEIKEGVSGNSKHVNLGEYGIKTDNGIYLFVNNATAIVYYH